MYNINDLQTSANLVYFCIYHTFPVQKVIFFQSFSNTTFSDRSVINCFNVLCRNTCIKPSIDGHSFRVRQFATIGLAVGAS